MISVKCPHCHVGLKVDEGKLPLDLTSFKCPKCKQPIPVSLLQLGKQGLDADQDTILVNPVSNGTGQLTVVGDSATPEQIFPLNEGIAIIGRKSNASNATIGIATADKSMKTRKEGINIFFLTIIVKTIRYIIAITLKMERS